MPPKRTRADRAGLSREQVLDAALAMADRDGLAALSMRKLGADLGVEAMTLYHYVPNKDALFDGIVERVMSAAEIRVADGDWQTSLAEYARALRRTLLHHPGALPLVATRVAVTPQTLRTAEHGLSVLRTAGFELGQALDIVNALTLFVIAHATSEAHTTPVNEARGPGSADHLNTLDPAEFPLITEAARTGAGTDDETRFEFAVAAMLHGFDALR